MAPFLKSAHIFTNIHLCNDYSKSVALLHGLSYNTFFSIIVFIVYTDIYSFDTPLRNEIEVNSHDDGVVQRWGGSSTDGKEGDYH